MVKNESEKTSDTFHSDANRFTQSTGSEFVGSKKLDRLDQKAKKSDKKVEKAKQKIPANANPVNLILIHKSILLANTSKFSF